MYTPEHEILVGGRPVDPEMLPKVMEVLHEPARRELARHRPEDLVIVSFEKEMDIYEIEDINGKLEATQGDVESRMTACGFDQAKVELQMIRLQAYRTILIDIRTGEVLSR